MKLGRAWAFPKVPWKWNGSPTFRQGHFSAISNRVSKKTLVCTELIEAVFVWKIILTGNCVLCIFFTILYLFIEKYIYISIFGTRSDWANDIWRRNLEVDKKSWNTIFPCLEGKFMEIHHLWKEFGCRFFCFTFSRRFFGHFRCGRDCKHEASWLNLMLRLYQFCKLTLEVLKNCLEKTAKAVAHRGAGKALFTRRIPVKRDVDQPIVRILFKKWCGDSIFSIYSIDFYIYSINIDGGSLQF